MRSLITVHHAVRETKISQKDFVAGIALAAILVINLLYWFDQSTVLSDAIADWGVARAVLVGDDPYTDVRDLVTHYGGVLENAGSTELGPGVWIHPRTPGALVLLAPTGLMTPAGAHGLHLIVSTIAVWILAVHLIPRVSSIVRSSSMLGMALLLASAPVYSSFEFGTISLSVAALILISWICADSARYRIAGLALGVAISLKVWPALLLVPLVVTRRLRAVRWALATFFVLQMAGSVVFKVTPVDLARAFSEASERWIPFSGNGSLTGTLVRIGIDPLLATISMIIVGTWAVWLVTARHETWSYPFAIVIGLLVSPLSWEHYDVALLGVAAVVLTIPRWPRVLGGAFLVLSLVGMPFRRFGPGDLTAVGLRALSGRFLLLAAVALAIHAVESNKGEHRGDREMSRLLRSQFR